MKLDKKERLNFANQLLILEALYPDQASTYSSRREVLERGYENHYSELFDDIMNPMSAESCNEILDILDMYTGIYFSYNELENPETIKKSETVFPGFDGNHETAQLGYTRFFIEKLGRYAYVKDSVIEAGGSTGFNGYNSHMRLLPKYRAMLERFQQHDGSVRNNLTEEQIKEVLDAKGDYSGF